MINWLASSFNKIRWVRLRWHRWMNHELHIRWWLTSPQVLTKNKSAGCCSVCVAVCCYVLQYVAICCSVLQCVVVCGGVIFVSSLLKKPSFTTHGAFWFIVPEFNIYVYIEKSLYACVYLQMHQKKKCRTMPSGFQYLKSWKWACVRNRVWKYA